MGQNRPLGQRKTLAIHKILNLLLTAIFVTFYPVLTCVNDLESSLNVKSTDAVGCPLLVYGSLLVFSSNICPGTTDF